MLQLFSFSVHCRLVVMLRGVLIYFLKVNYKLMDPLFLASSFLVSPRKTLPHTCGAGAELNRAQRCSEPNPGPGDEHT
jgi:hypothetical protein